MRSFYSHLLFDIVLGWVIWVDGGKNQRSSHYQQSQIAILSSSELKKAVLLRFHI